MKTIEELTRRAIEKGETDDMNLLELHCFLCIYQLLVMYHNNQISKDQATKLKQKIFRDYNNNVRDYEFKESMFNEHIENIKKTEKLNTLLRKQLNSNTELNEILNTAIEIIELYSGEKFS